MKRRTPLPFAAIAVAQVHCAAAAPPDPSALRASRVHDAADLARATDLATPLADALLTNTNIPGVVFALIKGTETRIVGRGHATDGGPPPDARTEFEIGSVTKVFTSLLLAKMALSAQLALDQPVQQLLPAEMRVPQFENHAITLAELSTHTSGLPRLPPNFSPANFADPYADFGVPQLAAALAATRLQRAPGASYEYSNYGAALLGYALATKAGHTYEQTLTNLLLEPLGLADTRITLTSEQQARLAQPHDAAGRPAHRWTQPVFAPAGALHSTITDMARFAHQNLALPTVLANEIALTHVPRAAAPAIHGSVGLGWGVLNDGRMLWHNGATGGYSSFIAVEPGADVAAVVLVNAQTDALDAFGFDLMRLLRGEPVAPPVARVTLSGEQMDALAGIYAFSPMFRIVVRRVGDRMEAQATNQGPFSVQATSATEMVGAGGEIRLSFEMGPDGHGLRLTLHQGGQDRVAARVPERLHMMLSAAQMDALVGTYALSASFQITVRRADAGLEIQATNQPAIAVDAASPTDVDARGVDASVTFELGPDGRATALVLHQGGRDQRGPRAP